ncbi:hypothetical protein HPHPH42_0080 [Helicobacter pylori Hp H-42]|uniref:Uncharacterized protein n=1 Tax=Helicobacter pylori Hp H-42 TaxID=992047 RepID=A0AB33XJX7_HELPX|nr:hypothetical protein HPHPH42_0080 [Helicobacter pylori Hp H-42]
MSAKINHGDCANNEGFPYFKINKTLKFGDSDQFYASLSAYKRSQYRD